MGVGVLIGNALIAMAIAGVVATILETKGARMAHYRITFEMDVESPTLRDAAAIADDFLYAAEDVLSAVQSENTDGVTIGVFGPASITWPLPDDA